MKGVKRILSYQVLVVITCTLLVLVSILLIDKYRWNSTLLQSTESKEKNEILAYIKNYYIGSYPSDEDIHKGELRGLVSSIKDPYSNYFDASDEEKFKDQLNLQYEGIGVRFQRKEGMILVQQVFSGSPAQEAGIKKGDILTSVDNESVEGLSLEQAASMIRGQAGTQVTVTILREGSSKEFSVERRKVAGDLITLDIQGKNAIIQLSSFGNNLQTKMQEVATKITLNNSIDRIILDLRGNTGGILDEGVAVASYFLEPGTIVAKEVTKSETQIDKSLAMSPSLRKYQLLVLVDETTASSSEIVAAALKENREDVQIIGQKTYGKGVVQSIFSLKNGNSLKLTIAKWQTPNGHEINEKGIEPDIPVSSELALERALSL